MRVWRAAALSAAVLIAAGCDSSAVVTPAKPSGPAPAARAPGYSVPLSRIIAAANAQNRGQPPFRLAPAGTKTSMPETTAEQIVLHQCNEGRGTRVLGAGLVTGEVEAGSPLYWAVFVDPPGSHIAPYSQPVKNPQTLNWIGAFVPVKNAQEPFCDFGRAASLPPLPVFRS